MLPLLGILGPIGWGIGGAILVGTAAYKYLGDDEVADKMEENRDFSKDRVLFEEIAQYKLIEQKRLKAKYYVDIEYIAQKNNVWSNTNHLIQDKIIIKNQSYTLEEELNLLDIELNELAKLVKQLEENKYVAIK